MKRAHFLTIISIVFFFASCSKAELENSPEKLDANLKKMDGGITINSAGDGEYDLLGFGLDATGDYLKESSISDAPIIDMDRFKADYLHRLNVITSTMGGSSSHVGVSAVDYMRDYSKNKSFDANGHAKIKGADSTTGVKNFNASLKKSSEDQSISKFSSKYSYAKFELWHRVKRIRFNGDVTPDLLSQYLTPDFASNLATLSATQLVNRYGTHVMLDISIGGKLEADYSGVVLNQSEYQKKQKATKMGLGFSVLGFFGININTDKTITEITEVKNETRERNWDINYIGGTNTGQSVSVDNNGYTSDTFNMASWQSGITAQNAALIDVDNTIFLYDLITDPVKKAAVKLAVETHINNSQIAELGEVPIYQYHHNANQDYLYSLSPNAINPSWPGWISQGAVFYAFNSAKNTSVPIYMYRHEGQKRNIYSSNPNYIQPNWPGWSPPVLAFYAYAQNNTIGTVPVYEFYNSQNECNMYSKNINAVFGYSGWVRTGIAFYVFP